MAAPRRMNSAWRSSRVPPAKKRGPFPVVSGGGNAPVKITGTASPLGTSGNTGVYVSGLVTTQNGALGITGTGGGSDGGGTIYSQGGNDGINSLTAPRSRPSRAAS